MEITQDNGTSLKITSEIGEAILPIVSSLKDKLPNLIGTVLSTADGFNICSLGLEDMDVGKMASLTSSLFSMGSSVLSTIVATDSITNDGKQVLLSIEDYQIIIVNVAYPSMEDFVLLVAVRNTSTGVVLVTINKVVDMLEKKFKNLDIG